ncbi:hypothetical protein [Microbacterium aoyamense]|nr:hypothetical protein [Microbacterium aoyamense]
MVEAAGVRVAWRDIAPEIRDAAADLLGSPIIEARTQRGGFSPGSADRVVCADGRRAFVKTATAAANPEVLTIHRREAAVNGILPPGVPAPRMIGAVDTGEWMLLAFDDVAGAQPALPWTDVDVRATVAAIDSVRSAPLDERAGAVLPAADVELAGLTSAWARIVQDPAGMRAEDLPREADAWAADDTLVGLHGDALVHYDIRADNTLIRPGGDAVLVDWPWALRGAGWIDLVQLGFNIRLHDPGFDVERLVREHPAFAGVPPQHVTRLLIVFGGFLLHKSREPDPPGLPTLRAFQRAQARAILEWVAERSSR